MSDNTIILSESHELIIASNHKVKSSSVKQMILDGVMGEIDKEAEVCVKKWFEGDDLVFFEDSKSGLYGFENVYEEVIIEAKFYYTYGFSGGFAAVQKGKDGKWGFIKVDGLYHIEPEYEDVKYFSEGLAGVKIGDKWGFINTEGLVVIEPRFDDDMLFNFHP